MDEQLKEEKLQVTSSTWKDTVLVAPGKVDTESYFLLVIMAHILAVCLRAVAGALLFWGEVEVAVWFESWFQLRIV